MENFDYTEFEGLIRRAFSEDAVFDDVTSAACVDADHFGIGELVLKQDGVIAGIALLPLIFQMRDERLIFEAKVEDGQFCQKGTVLGRVTGPAIGLLSAERTALNLLQHLSGIATLTARCVAETKGSKCKILDTRKTLLGYRQLQKYAVKIGGGTNHRLHLADQILIKNNHLSLANGVKAAIERCKGLGRKIQVEVGSYEQLLVALDLGVDSVMLDNMNVEDVRKCVDHVNGEVFLEASGGITLEKIGAFAATGVDGISIGALTHSAPALDIAFRIR